MWRQRVRAILSGNTIDDASLRSLNLYDDDEELRRVNSDDSISNNTMRITYTRSNEVIPDSDSNSLAPTLPRGSVHNSVHTGFVDADIDKDNCVEKTKGAESEEEDEDSGIPDGGWRAWLCVLGAFCGITSTFGISNGTGTIQDYLLTERLKGQSETKIGWIFSLWLFIMYAGSVQTGPIFDAYGPRVLLIPGCIGWTLSVFMLSLCKEFYQFILAFSILGGLSTSMIFNPSVAVLGQYFNRRRSLATGISFLGGSAGGVFVPLMLEHLFPQIGYGWSIRVLGFIVLGLSIVTCICVQGRTTREDVDWREALPDIKSLRHLDFAACTAGVFLVEWGFFVPVIYLVGYARSQGLSSGYSNAIIAYMNIASSFGRVIPGWLADRYGCYNVVIISCLLTGIFCCAVWIPAGTTKAGLTVFVVLFGLGSGSTISATPNCVANISPLSDYGKRYGTAYSLASIAVLTGAPIAGALTDNNYLGLQLFAGCSFILAGIAFIIARLIAAGRKLQF